MRPEVHRMTPEQMIAHTERVQDELLHDRSWAVVEELYHREVVWHGPGGDVHGLDDVRASMERYATAFPGMHFTNHDQMVSGDTVITRWTVRGVHAGPLGDIPATGRSVELTGVILQKFEGDKIIEEWEEFDMMNLMQQIGALPTG